MERKMVESLAVRQLSRNILTGRADFSLCNFSLGEAKEKIVWKTIRRIYSSVFLYVYAGQIQKFSPCFWYEARW